MANQRKQIILNEITFWKQNKLLPAHYCDFLMTLYTEGEQSEIEERKQAKGSLLKKSYSKTIALMTLLAAFLGALIYALFTVTNIQWLMPAIVAIVALALMFGTLRLLKQNNALAPLLQVFAALLIFMLSLHVSQTFYPDSKAVLYSLLIANCGLWLGSGIVLKALYFTIPGAVGLLFIIGNFFWTM